MEIKLHKTHAHARASTQLTDSDVLVCEEFVDLVNSVLQLRVFPGKITQLTTGAGGNHHLYERCNRSGHFVTCENESTPVFARFFPFFTNYFNSPTNLLHWR